MAIVIEHKKVDDNFYLLEVSYPKKVECGQFFMVHSPNKSHILGRPLSVFNREEGKVSFLYQVLGEGTRELTSCKKGDEVKIFGPYGNSFPTVSNKKIACIGGGLGIAPFYYYAKTNQEKNDISLYLGLREEARAEHLFEDLNCNIIVQKGGFITDGVPYGQFDMILTCGPKKMMEKVVQKGEEKKIPVYISMEERMGCGFGGCLGCSIKTIKGHRRVCKDGPIFLGKEVFYESLKN